MILGANFQTASPKETPFLIAQLIDNLTYRLEAAESDTDKLFAILDTHIQFERIHPFSDGNGRTGRMLLIYPLLEQGLPPLIIEKENKAKYIEFLGNQDVEGFLSFAKKLLAQEEKRIQPFQNMANEQIKYD